MQQRAHQPRRALHMPRADFLLSNVMTGDAVKSMQYHVPSACCSCDTAACSLFCTWPRAMVAAAAQPGAQHRRTRSLGSCAAKGEPEQACVWLHSTFKRSCTVRGAVTHNNGGPTTRRAA